MPTVSENVLYAWIMREMHTFNRAPLVLPDGTGARLSLIPSSIAGKHLFAILDLDGKELSRFTVNVSVLRQATPTDNLTWIHGQWGPTKIHGGLSYATTPVIGDVAISPVDDSHWHVVKGLTADNPHSIRLTSILDGQDFSFHAKWDDKISFRRGDIKAAIDILAQSLDARELSDAELQQENWIVRPPSE